jgi:hypothetical protein
MKSDTPFGLKRSLFCPRGFSHLQGTSSRGLASYAQDCSCVGGAITSDYVAVAAILLYVAWMPTRCLCSL